MKPLATPPSGRTRVRRQPRRARYDRATVDAVLDAQLVAHVAFVHDGQPFCVPMLHARVGDRLLVHGSTASRALRALGAGAPACVTVTAVDGLVLARSVFEHSANYRSAMLLGRFRVVEGERERLAAFQAFTDKLVPGRWDEVRRPSRAELAATTVLAMPIEEATAKVRSGPPDDAADAGVETWAGVVPVVTGFGEPQAAPGPWQHLPPPASVRTLLARQSPAEGGSP